MFFDVPAQTVANPSLFTNRGDLAERCPAMVHNVDVSIVPNSVTRVDCSLTKIHLFKPDKKPIVERTDFLDELASNAEKRAHDLIHVL